MENKVKDAMLIIYNWAKENGVNYFNYGCVLDERPYPYLTYTLSNELRKKEDDSTNYDYYKNYAISSNSKYSNVIIPKETLNRWLELLGTDGSNTKSMVRNDINELLKGVLGNDK